MAVTSLYASREAASGAAQVDICSLQINMRHDVIPSVACSLCIALGLVYSFFGYRCFKMVMFFSGFLSGSAAVLLLFQQEAALDAQLGLETKAGTVLGVSVLCGLGAMLLTPLGLVLGGVQLGAVLGLALLLPLARFYSLSPAWLPLAAAASAATVCAVFALQWPKPLTVAHTCALGAAAVTLGADHLLGGWLQGQAVQLLRQEAPPPLCWFHWAIGGVFPLLGVSGLLVQWRFTARGVSHTEAAHRKQKKYGGTKQSCRDSRRRPRTHRRRRPPPLKRYAGDVLAPSYLQSLQERQSGTSSSSSSVSTITHTLIDFDFETGSMVPLTAASPAFAV